MPNLPKSVRFKRPPAEPSKKAGHVRKLRSSRRWRKFRVGFIGEYPLCCNPFSLDLHLEGTAELHHITRAIDDPSKFFDPHNIAPLCKRCHARVTRMEEKDEDTTHLFEN